MKMLNQDPRKVIKIALLTEKGTRQKADFNEYIFMVEPGSNKIEIKKAVENLFKVKVENVRTMMQHGKFKSFGRFKGQKADWKKAVVKLAAENKIELFEGV
ncbi:MAG: 50S ribosomal protein L23 [candidate division Zixibacteria bacterium]|nr:50S ribosomal protein L23 [candidate division Zixibacteria bacterium]